MVSPQYSIQIFNIFTIHILKNVFPSHSYIDNIFNFCEKFPNDPDLTQIGERFNCILFIVDFILKLVECKVFDAIQATRAS